MLPCREIWVGQFNHCRALALPVPRVSPTPASRAVFFAAVCPAHVCLLAAAGSRGCQANTPRRAKRPGGLRVPLEALPAAKGTLSVRRPLLARRPSPCTQRVLVWVPWLHLEHRLGLPLVWHTQLFPKYRKDTGIEVGGWSERDSGGGGWSAWGWGRDKADDGVLLLSLLGWVSFCLAEVWDRLQGCDGPFPAVSHMHIHQGHMPRGKARLPWELSSLAPLSLWQGYLGPCLSILMLVLFILCWQRSPRPA